uniref:Mutator-like transposase domain-containing protein n=1 Tax=Magallana gigas TaxID=29159 RepID=A0A8W8P2E2_MAGGI
MLRLRDYHRRLQGVQSKHSNRGAHFEKQREGEKDGALLSWGTSQNNFFRHLCKTPLHLKDTVRERRYGLSSVLHVQCTNCSAVCPVETGKRGPTGAFDINTNAALGMIHVGMGPTHLVNFLGQCNIPPPSEPSIRKHAAKVGKAITDVTLASCRAVPVEEKQTSDTSRIILFPVMIAHKIGLEVARRRKLTWQCQWHINLQIMTLCFRFTSLPNGKPLHGDGLRKELETLVEKYKGRIENMRDLGSTQSNENFNNIVSTKAPKNRYYGGSSSLKRRVSAAVLQKNEGHSYLVKAMHRPTMPTVDAKDVRDVYVTDSNIKRVTVFGDAARLFIHPLKSSNDQGELCASAKETIYIDSGSYATPSIGSTSSESFSSSSSSHLSTSFSTITGSPSTVSSRSTSPEITSSPKRRLTTELASKQGANETSGKQIGDLNKLEVL